MSSSLKVGNKDEIQLYFLDIPGSKVAAVKRSWDTWEKPVEDKNASMSASLLSLRLQDLLEARVVQIFLFSKIRWAVKNTCRARSLDLATIGELR